MKDNVQASYKMIICNLNLPKVAAYLQLLQLVYQFHITVRIMGKCLLTPLLLTNVLHLVNMLQQPAMAQLANGLQKQSTLNVLFVRILLYI